MLQGMRILVVEDDFIIAAELAAYFSGVGATVLGPVPSVNQAMRYLNSVDGAIHDIDLNGMTVFPLADELVKRDVPFVFFSGKDDVTLPERFRYAHNLPKPVGFREAADILSAISNSQSSSMERMLPKLKLAARLEQIQRLMNRL